MLNREEIVLISGYIKNNLSQKQLEIFFTKFEQKEEFKAEYQKKLVEAKIDEIDNKISELVKIVAPGKKRLYEKDFSLKEFFCNNNSDRELHAITFLYHMVTPYLENIEILGKFLDIKKNVLELSQMAGNIIDEEEYILNLDHILKNLRIQPHNNHETKVPDFGKLRSTGKKKKNILVAAISTLAIILIGFSIKLTFFGNISSDDLYKSYYSPFQEIQFASADSKEINQAKDNYFRGNYYSAITMLLSIPDSTIYLADISFYKGLTYMALKEFDEAIFCFKFIADKPSNEYLLQADWYLALCYLKTESREKTIEQLNRVAKENQLYSAKANKLLRKLNRDSMYPL